MGNQLYVIYKQLKRYLYLSAFFVGDDKIFAQAERNMRFIGR